LLVPYAVAGPARLTLLLGCYAMFGISLFASVIIITLVWGRLVTYKTLPAVMVPTSWIVLGPLGQSVTATGNLAKVAGLTLHAPYATGADVFALLYGVPTWGFAMAWLAIAAAMTLRAVRKGLPFGLTWWSFTFPVGTCVTGTIGLAARTGADGSHGCERSRREAHARARALVAPAVDPRPPRVRFRRSGRLSACLVGFRHRGHGGACCC